MRTILLICSVIAIQSAATLFFRPAYADNQAGSALSGQVASAEEGKMEGVLVSAKRDGTTITTTVITDERGVYRFPVSRLAPGHYTINIRATGYDLNSPAAIDISSSHSATLNLKLRKTADLAAQLSNSEWLLSFPGTEGQKASIRGCTHCHTLEPIVRSRHNADEFMQVLDRMSHYTPESFPLMIQPPTPGRTGGGELSTEQQARQMENRRKQAEYLSSLNLSGGPEWSYALKTLPRAKGRATRVILTEYDLPQQTRQPHDVVVDAQGIVWYAAFGEPILSKMDPRTGKVTEFPIPVVKRNTVVGNLDLEFDKGGNLWIAMTFQAAVAKFERKTEKFQVFELPPEFNADYRELTFVSPTHSDVDGKVWINDSGSYTQFRLDIASGKFEQFEAFPVPRPNVYQIVSDAQNNGWFMVMGREDVGKIDAKTGEISVYKTPTPNSGPRRGMIDSQGQLWFGENRGNRVGMFDPRTKQFKEWSAPTPEFNPYDVTVDKNDEAWAVTEFSDALLRVNTKTGEMVEYPMPRATNMRRAFIDNSTTPVTFWVGNTHAASIVKVEPLD